MRYKIWDNINKEYLDKRYSVNQDGDIVFDNVVVIKSDDKNYIIQEFLEKTDRNKCELFEGDIVIFGGLKGKLTKNSIETYGKIQYKSFYDYDGMKMNYSDVIKIGNVCTNPELYEMDTIDPDFLCALKILKKQFPDRKEVNFKINEDVIDIIFYTKYEEIEAIEEKINSFWYNDEGEYESSYAHKYEFITFNAKL